MNTEKKLQTVASVEIRYGIDAVYSLNLANVRFEVIAGRTFVVGSCTHAGGTDERAIAWDTVMDLRL